MDKFKMPHWLAVLICAVWPHDWRSDNNVEKHCHRCKTERHRSPWNWDKWLRGPRKKY